MWAAAQRHPDVTGLLIEAGAEINARSRTFPQTVVGEQTQRFGREELNYTVLRGGSTPLLFAARSGDAASARLLLAAGASANDHASGRHERARRRRAQRSHAKSAGCCWRRAPIPNAADAGYTAMHAAVLRSDLTLVKALLERGANPNIRHARGTPHPPRYDRLQPAGDAHRLDAVSAGGALPRARNHEGAGRRWGRRDADDARWRHAVDGGGRRRFGRQFHASRHCGH